MPGPLKTRINGIGIGNQIFEASLHQQNSKPAGLVTYSTDLERFETSALVFSDVNGSVQMAVDASFSGAPEGVHDGIDTVLWAATAVMGTWDFNSAAQAQSGSFSIDATSTISNDLALFSAPGAISLANHVALTGHIYLTSFNSSRHAVEIRTRFSGSNVGTAFDVVNSIDPGLLNVWQKFVVTKEDLEVTSETINEIVVETLSTSGQPPNYFLDSIQFEKQGGRLFIARPAAGQRIDVEKMNIILTFQSSGTLVGGTMPILSHNKWGSLPTLSPGIIFQRCRKGKIAFAAPLTNLEDLLFFGADITAAVNDGTNTTIKISFLSGKSSFILDGSTDDEASFLIAEDLSSLVSMKVVVLGAEFISEDFKK